MDSLPAPKNIYCMGLTCSQHLKEAASDFDPDIPPPVFKKSLASLTENGALLTIPPRNEIISAVGQLENDVVVSLNERFESLSPLLDYEVELGFVLLTDIAEEDFNDDHFIPQIGFFIANDLSARSVALL